MLAALQIIYNRLVVNNPKALSEPLETEQVLRFLEEKSKIDPANIYYLALINQIIELKSKKVDPVFVERFCLARLSDQILLEYPVNIAEAFVIAFVLLNGRVEKNLLHFKLGYSGLIAPTVIKGNKINDVEAIAQFILNSLYESEILKLVDTQWVYPGKNLFIKI